MQEKYFCPVYKKCGGCQLDVPYRQQLNFKQRTVNALLGKFGRVKNIIGMDDPVGYRCKVSSAFGYSRGQVICGVWQSSSGKIVQTQSCLSEDSRATAIIQTIKKLLPKFALTTYDERKDKGFLRFVTVRIGKATGEILVVLGTGHGAFATKKDFVNELVRLHPEITTVTQNVSTDRLNLLVGRNENVLYGRGFITDRLCGCDFRISPRSFFQVNPTQTENLYATAISLADLSPTDRVMDAYCGVGTMGIIAAKSAGQVTAVELNADAAKNAAENALLNGIDNIKVIAADAGEYMKKAAANGEKFDVVFTDPPRQGCSREFLKALIALAPQRVVYVSCNPETLARDLTCLVARGYTVNTLQPVDMFPFTRHVECVVKLCRA